MFYQLVILQFQEYWVCTSPTALQNTIINLVEQLALALSGEFKVNFCNNNSYGSQLPL